MRFILVNDFSIGNHFKHIEKQVYERTKEIPGYDDDLMSVRYSFICVLFYSVISEKKNDFDLSRERALCINKLKIIFVIFILSQNDSFEEFADITIGCQLWMFIYFFESTIFPFPKQL